MSSTLNASLQCDPGTKFEIWLFQKIGQSPQVGSHGKPIYRRLPYNLVSWDGDPTQYVEPVQACGDFARSLEGSGDPINPRTDGVNRIIGFQFYDARPFEVFALNDVDVLNNLGQLP